jgi:hypothetical protein
MVMFGLPLSRDVNTTENGAAIQSLKSGTNINLPESNPHSGPSAGWDGPGRGSARLTFYIGAVPAYLDRAAVESAIESALAKWAAVANITFTKTTLPNQLRSIDFTFAKIDGPGGTLAQASLPHDVDSEPTAGDVQFDSAEAWEIGNASGHGAFDLVHVALHEIGHALGLEHSRAIGSVMAPTVSPDQSSNGLDRADGDAILRLYAPARRGTAPPVSSLGLGLLVRLLREGLDASRSPARGPTADPSTRTSLAGPPVPARRSPGRASQPMPLGLPGPSPPAGPLTARSAGRPGAGLRAGDRGGGGRVARH